MKRGFESVSSARYRTPFAPPTNLGSPAPAHPLQALATPDAALRAPSVVPTTTASNKKTNVQIPYTRVVNDARHLPRERGELVFVRAVVDATVAGKLRVSAHDRTEFLAGLDAVNAKIGAADPEYQEEEAEAWSVDGVLISTEREMDPEEMAWTTYDEPVTSSTAVLIALQGHTVLRNVFSDRAFVGDYCYVGLVQPRGKEPRWVPFSSQHLDMVHAPEPPTAPQLGFHGTATRKRVRVAFTEEDAAGLCSAYCIGRVVDSAPTPGDVTVNVQVRRMSWTQLGVRHDEEHARLVPARTQFKDSKGRVRRALQHDSWVYPPNQRIGRDCVRNDRILRLLRRWMRHRLQLGGEVPELPKDVGDYCLNQAYIDSLVGNAPVPSYPSSGPPLQLFGPIVITVCAIMSKWRGSGQAAERAALRALVGTPDDVFLVDAKRRLDDAKANALLANLRRTLPTKDEVDAGTALGVEDKPGLIDYEAIDEPWEAYDPVQGIDDDQRPLVLLGKLAERLDDEKWAGREAEERALALLGEAASAILAGVGGSDMLGRVEAGVNIDGVVGVEHPEWIEMYLEAYAAACVAFLGRSANPSADPSADSGPRLADVVKASANGEAWELPFFDEDEFDGVPLKLVAAAAIEVQGPRETGPHFAKGEWNEETTLGLLLRCAMALLLAKAALRSVRARAD